MRGYNFFRQDRILTVKLLLYGITAVFIMRIINFQIIKHSRYTEIAERNRTQIISQNAPRGRIFTADSVLVAGNKPSFTLAYFPLKSDLPDPAAISGDISKYLRLPEKEVHRKVLRAIRGNVPVKLAEGLEGREMLMVSELKTFYPGLSVISEARRFYPKGNFLSHIVGFMGKISPKEWKVYKKRKYNMDAYVGKSGLERKYEKFLKGEDGGIYLEVDSKGRLIQILESRKSLPGGDIYLTINSAAQEAAETGLKNSLSGEGAVVAMDPRNGRILALADYPSFDPEEIMLGETKKRDMQEFNLAVQGTFPPASVFKIIVSAAGIETGKLDIHRKILCPGYFDAGSRIFRCWKKDGHGKVDYFLGLAHSCDVYYYNAGIETGPYNMEKFARMFGIGEKTGMDIDNESPGNLFGPTKRMEKKRHWFVGDTLNMSIGQGEMLVTPLQMAQIISMIANGGKVWRPYYVDRIKNRYGDELLKKGPLLKRTVALKPGTWSLLREGLRKVVEEGTGRAARIEGIKVFGKTGTAQNPHGKDHAWFVAYAQAGDEAPEIAVSVLVAFGEHGASAAAPIAREVIKAVLKGRTEGDKI